MKAEIISTGEEIRSGVTIDTNAAYIARKLEDAGIDVVRHCAVGDDMEEMGAVFLETAARADMAAVTGGLGPTSDDLTAAAAAKAFGLQLIPNQNALAAIEAFFKTKNLKMSERNKKQALLPQGAECLDNPVGTAPGFCVTLGACVFFFLPGVPFEMKRMLADHVLPRTADLYRDRKPDIRRHRTFSTFGLPESVVEDRLQDFTRRFPDIRLGFRAKFPEIQVKLYASGQDEPLLDRALDQAGAWVAERLEKHVLPDLGESMEAVVGRLLLENKATIAVAESCTGGLIAHKLTSVPGSSGYFLFSGVTYANEAKIAVLGVSPDTLMKYGAVHEETAKEMAAGARRVAGSDYGLSTTGIAGPDGGSEEKPVGTVCIGLAGPDGVTARRYTFSFPSRAMNKEIFAAAALNRLRMALMENEKTEMT